MSIMDTKFPAKVKFSGNRIDVHAGEDISPVLNQDVQFIRLKERMYTKSHTFIADVECGFDIETTSTEKGAFMYKWQFVFGEYILSGRTWDEFFTVMESIERAYQFGTRSEGRGKKRHTYIYTPIMWIANQGYEFQFMCRRMWNGHYIVQTDERGNVDVFADAMRRPLKTMLGFTGRQDNPAITVYDALKFSTSLSQLAKDYCLTKKAKKVLEDGTVVSDLDYSIPRNSQTTLNDEEDAYCDADVAILYEWAHYYLDAYVKQNNIAPMTSTGIIRAAVLESYDESATRTDWYDTLAMHPSFGEYYRAIKYLYRGGFTYGHRAKAGKVIENVVGKDFTSSYPACFLNAHGFEGYPTTPFATRHVDSEEDLEKYRDKCWYADFEFTDIIQTRGISVENCAKMHEWRTNAAQCKAETGVVIDNGKVAYAHKMTVTLSMYDYEVYKMFYHWNNVKISKLMVAERGPLPEWFTRVIKHYYKLKANLKATGKAGTTEYALAKAVVNGLYGMSIQRQIHPEITFDPTMTANPKCTWDSKNNRYSVIEERVIMEEEYEKAIGRDKKSVKFNEGKPKVVTNPYWGIFCTSIARYRLMKAIYELGNDFVYCDTDSVYYENEDDHIEYFYKWNSETYRFNDDNLIEPEFHTLGDFDPVELEDGSGILKYSFKTLGAKRYIKWTDTHIHATVAGLPKGSLQRMAAHKLFPNVKQADFTDDNKRDIVNYITHTFEASLEVAAEDALKNAHFYIDKPVEDTVTDLHGHTEVMREESCMVIYPIDFTLKIPEHYRKIMGMSVREFILTECYKQMNEERERLK